MKFKLFYVSLFLFLVYCSLVVGTKNFSLGELFQGKSDAWLLLGTTRLPRTISLVLTGGMLALLGLLMQHISQNPFVSPSTTGTMDAARLGIVMVMLFLPESSPLVKIVVAFLFAFLGSQVFLWLVKSLPKGNKVMIPLVGLMFGNIIGALATFIAYQNNMIQNMSSWLQGNFSLVMAGNYESLFFLVPMALLIYVFAKWFMVLGFGEDFTINLGISYGKVQGLALLLISLTSSLILLTVGQLPFLGVVIPNLVTLKKGQQLQKNIFPTAFFGSVFLLVCDLLARLLIHPYELPVSVVVGSLGSFIFLMLLIKDWRIS